MKIYKVGGCVRDKLLGIAVKDTDWVVIGSTPEAMINLGYKQVGEGFPVFLHPDSHEEYALARSEVKTGPGYKGFAFEFTPDITLEQDLLRRDLTINAIAEDENGNIIDPFNGVADLKGKILRHVSLAFVEDPVRLLRLARFYAKFYHLGFTIAEETQALVKKMVLNHEIDALVPERVVAELLKALMSESPIAFFQALQEAGALQILFPHLGQQQIALDLLQIAVAQNSKLPVRFSILCHLMGHSIDEGTKQLKQFFSRYPLSRELQDNALLVVKYHQVFPTIKSLNAESLLSYLMRLDGLRQQERLQNFLDACEIIYPQQKQYSEIIRQGLNIITKLDVEALVQQGFSQKALVDEIKYQRILLLQQHLKLK